MNNQPKPELTLDLNDRRFLVSQEFLDRYNRPGPRYTEAVERRGIATMRGYRLTEDDRLHRTVINQLLCHAVIRKDEIASEFNLDFDETFAPQIAQLAPFVEDGLVELTSDEIRVTLLGRIFIRNVAMLFDPYLAKQKLAERPLFSKTL